MSNGTESAALQRKPLARPTGLRLVQQIAVRIAGIVLFAMAVDWVLTRVAAELERSSRPAGFVRGMVQGALMPMSMHNLLVGKDITIYSVNNTGLPYKVGYTAGTNSCGAIFFGLFFWRVRRWRATSAVSPSRPNQV